MTAAIALAIVLAIVVAGASMALESQRAAGQPARPRPARPAARPPRTGPAPTERSRRTLRPTRERTPAESSVPDYPPPSVPAEPPESRGPELLRSGKAGQAKVVSVVDERIIGPVTRSRLVLRIQPEGAEPIEVTVRHAFPTPQSRGQVAVGADVPVRYDPSDPHRVVIDLPRE